MKDECKRLALQAAPVEGKRKCQIWTDLKRAGIFPMLILVAALSVSVRIYVGDLALDPLSWERWKGIGVIICLFIMGLFILDLIASFAELGNYRDQQSGQVNISALWRKVYTNPLNGIILIGVMTYGITSAQGLSEYYRANITTWYDAELWGLEAPFISLLKGSLIDIPEFWDVIYFAYWLYLILVYCALYRLRQLDDLSTITIATVISYFLTRWVAIQFPTAGPVFHQPDYFNVAGTVSDYVQKSLVLYMHGQVPQNGFIPGTMGMPSLHIGITFIAAYYLARHVSWTLWLSVAWVGLIWLSTVMLGWHYMLDGVGGILVAIVSVQAAGLTLKLYRKTDLLRYLQE
jgi:membrane-associated phospholipid phosphatase